MGFFISSDDIEFRGRIMEEWNHSIKDCNTDLTQEVKEGKIKKLRDLPGSSFIVRYGQPIFRLFT